METLTSTQWESVIRNLSEDDAEIIRKSYEEDPTHSSKEIKNILQNSGKNVQMQPD